MKTLFIAIFLVTSVFANAQNTKTTVKPQKMQVSPTMKADVYQTITEELLKNCEGTDKKIAVAGFSYSDGRDSRDGSVVAERITTELVKAKRFKVIERKEIEKVFEELKLQRSGAIDSDSAKEIGKLLGADWVAVGTLTELPGKQIELNARVVNVESGEILNAYKDQLAKNWSDQYKKFLDEQNNAIKKNAKDSKAFYEKGVINMDLKEYDNAIAAFSMAISISPTYFEAYHGRGKAYFLQEVGDKAIEDFSRAIVINPKFALAYLGRGAAYFFFKNDYDKTIVEVSKAIEINPKLVGAYRGRGDAYSRKGEYDRAIKDYSKAIEIDSEFAETYQDRGNTYHIKGESSKALKDWGMALKLNPGLQQEIQPLIDAIKVQSTGE